MLSFRWWMVTVAVLGLIVGPGPINIFSFGVFVKPMAAELGTSREVLSFALLLTTIAGALSNPVVGALIDRFGTRPTLVWLIPTTALGLFARSLVTPSHLDLFATFFLVGFTGTVTGPTGYAALVARWFDRERGLALGIAMAGVGLGVALVPALAAYLISAFGWRAAYRALGVLVLVLAWLPAFFIRDPAPADLARLSDTRPDGTLAGVGLLAALASWRFWALTVAFFLSVVAINGTVAHTVPMLTDRGVSMALATTAVSASGFAIILGRILSGWCLDRFSGRAVAVAFFMVPMAGILILAEGGGAVLPIFGAALCGLAVGAEIDLMAFFVSRYFGIRAYGRVYGTMFSLFNAGNGVGPFIGGYSFSHYHGYGPALILFEAALVLTCLLFVPLGPYPYPAPRRAGAAQPAAASA
ncbi:MAG TPA: MFS transporter [Stellaceae bacterium]|nr:MFS transporter [Stellaceae bacterium]